MLTQADLLFLMLRVSVYKEMLVLQACKSPWNFVGTKKVEREREREMQET
jgi:hypothetical protein